MWRLTALLLIISLAVLPYCSPQNPLENCAYNGGETFLCRDRKSYCVDDLGLDFNYENLENHCKDKEIGYYDPSYACNCGIRCIKQLEKGDSCRTSYTSDYPDELCGNGMECLWDSDAAKLSCDRNTNGNECIKEIVDYEEHQAAGTLGPAQLYPKCDDLGQFAPKQCSSSSTCYCTDTEGNRLFGEAVYTEESSMNCECSVYRNRNSELGISDGLRCIANGNTDGLQCNVDFCYCYNSTSQAMTQGPAPVNVATELDCFQDAYHRKNFTTECFSELQTYIEMNPDSDEFVVEASLRPNCGLDGMYDIIQPSGAGYYCSDKYGKLIENFQFTAVEKKNSNCYCANRRHLMTEAGLLDALPECCPNGNYNPYQTRGMFAYCVDDNGNQEGDALAITDMQSLPCFTTCPEV